MPKPLSRAAYSALALAAIPILCLTCWRSFRAAQADLLERQPSLAAARRAIAITPESARAHDYAAMLYAASNPMTAMDDAELRAAVALNPRDASAWMSMGLKSEMEGNTAQAEQYLLQAAEVDRMFKPAWSLANFYFRTGQQEKFWPWARKCLELVEHRNGERWTFDPWPIFELCWKTTDDGATIGRLAIPSHVFILGRYVDYLIATNRLPAALEAADRLYPLAQTGGPRPNDVDWLYSLCDALIRNNRGADAARVWNALSARHLIPYARIDAAAGHSLTNGDFQAEPSGRGFDWQVQRPADVYERYSPVTRTLRFDIGGDEPENCELMGQPVVLLPARHYRLRFRYRTAEIAGAPGLRWTLLDPASHREIAALPLLRGREDEGEQADEFAAPRGAGLARLELRYDRQPGTVRPKGSLNLGPVALELLP